MPFVRISIVAATLTPEQIRHVQQGTTDLMVSVMRKALAGVVVFVEHVTGGASIAGARADVAAHVDATIGRTTNTPDEKARFISGMTQMLLSVFGPGLKHETYVVLHEIEHDAYGRGGVTRAERESGARVQRVSSDTRSDHGETVLLLHGSASSAALWRQYVESFSGCGYRVVAPDLIGYGKAGAWPDDRLFSLEDELAAVRAFVPRDGSRCHVVGHSYGGLVALALATGNPAALASLTLIEPAAFAVLRHAGDAAAYAEVSRLRDAVEAEVKQGRGEAALRTFLEYWTGPGSWESLPTRARAEMLGSVNKIRLDWEASFAMDLDLEAVHALRVKTLLVYGARSPQSTRHVTAALGRMLPSATLTVIDDANHLLPLTHGPALTDALLAHFEAARNAGFRRG